MPTAAGYRHTRIGRDHLTVVHISDLHFSDHAVDTDAKCIHSQDLLVGLEVALRQTDFDLVVVSGDLTDWGDLPALLRARDYLLGSYSVGHGRTVGLNLAPDKLRIFPGNHDAFNVPKSGSTFERWQKSLSNYRFAFPECLGAIETCGWEWIELQGWEIYMAFADTCFIGDPENEVSVRGIRYYDDTAKGKLSRDQAAKLLSWSDKGRRGALEASADKESCVITAEKFKASLRLLLMHHYIFDPSAGKRERLMELLNRNDVFANIALADFDMLLCGHKHTADFGRHTYGYHLGRRGKYRYILNLLRHAIGMPSSLMPDSPPLRRLSKYFRRLVGILGSSEEPEYDEADLGKLLELALLDSKAFRKRVRELLRGASRHALAVPNEAECEQIVSHIESSFNKAERQKIGAELKKAFEGVLRKISQRTFIQALSGSTTKRPTSSDKPRGFFKHVFSKNGDSYQVRAERFEWTEQSKSFALADTSVAKIPIDRF